MIEDIYYALLDYYDSKIDALETLDLLAAHIDNDDILGKDMKKFIYDKCIESDLCHYCLGTLETYSTIDNIHEYMGKQVEETHTRLKCTQCGRKY